MQLMSLNHCPARRHNWFLPSPQQLIERVVKWRVWWRSLTRPQLGTRWSLSGRCAPHQRLGEPQIGSEEKLNLLEM
jgi:hypothetical protein